MASSLLWIGNLQPDAEFLISKILHRLVQRRIATIECTVVGFFFLFVRLELSRPFPHHKYTVAQRLIQLHIGDNIDRCQRFHELLPYQNQPITLKSIIMVTGFRVSVLSVIYCLCLVVAYEPMIPRASRLYICSFGGSLNAH